MRGPGDDEELFENRYGEDVPKDDLTEAELAYHEMEDPPSGGIDDFCRGWERGEGFDDVDPEAFDKDSD